MNDEEIFSAFSKIVDESISNPAIRSEILRDIRAQLEVRGVFPAKGFLAEINKHSDMRISNESSELIKKIFYHYG